MSASPVMPRRLSTASAGSSRHEEELINAYEAEEERIINILSRKLEKLREDKLKLENVLEAESEFQVNRLHRELQALRMQSGQDGESSAAVSASVSPQARYSMHDPRYPPTDVILDAVRRENEQLRTRLVSVERDYVRIDRLNEIYREELIEHRRRLGISVDNLIGLPGAVDPMSQPLHRRNESSKASSASSTPARQTSGLPPMPRSGNIPIPRPPSQIRRSPSSITPPSSIESAHLIMSPPTSYSTHLTTPQSSNSLQAEPPAPFPLQPRNILTYPSVPPPSLSSSLGSPTVPFRISGPPSPVESPPPVLSRGGGRHRRGSSDWRVAETGNLRDLSRSRRESVERGGRIAETGTLRPRGNSSAAPN